MFSMIIGFIFGYLFGIFIGGKAEGERGRIHWDWWLDNCKIHLHHWIIMTIILVIFELNAFRFNLTKSQSEFIISFLLGGIIHGLSYSDRFKLF
jgi:hypothetical protein